VIRRTGARGLYYDTRALLKDIRSTYNPVTHTAEMDVIRPVMEAELLVLDDLGAERLTDWVEETMSMIVNTRYNERRATIFTSNYEDVPDESEMNSLLVRVGFRLHSRCVRCAISSNTTDPITGTCRLMPAQTTSTSCGRPSRGASCRPVRRARFARSSRRPSTKRPT
jgi:DNA replication protein DnaC